MSDTSEKISAISFVALVMTLIVVLVLHQGGLNNCEKTHNVYKCKWITVPVEEE